MSWTFDEFKEHLASAIARGDNDPIATHYLGFSVIRPLPTAPIGRTVLRTYRGIAERCFAPAELTHRVHLAGLTIELPGLPFQQQDQGVAACATTAVWSALTKVIRADGGESTEENGDLPIGSRHRTKLRSRGIDRWYAHDDRLGAYARLGFVTTQGEQRHIQLKLLPSEAGYEHLETPMVFSEAIVPLYPKLR